MAIGIGADLNATYSTLDEGKTPALGDVFEGTDGKRYRFVQYDTGAGSVAAVAGNFAYIYAPSGTSAGATNVVTSDLSDSAGVGAGVLQGTPGDGEYGWVQISGIATLTPALTAGADGDALTPTGAGDGTLDLAVAGETDHICAHAIDASAKIVILHSMG